MAGGLRTRGRRRLVGLVAVAVASLGLVSCGGGVEDTKSAKGDCGDLRIAINPWTGYVSNAHVIGEVAKAEFGCNVTYPEVKEEVAWQGMASGSIDTVVENWGHDELIKKYITQQKSVVDAGPTGGLGRIGWYVPPWMAEKYPDITDWKNLNKYADLFKTSESGDKGQMLVGDPSYVSNDEAIVKNLKLDYKVVVSGSEAGLIQSLRSAEKNKKPLLAYFYEPQWFFSEMKLVHIDLPPFKEGCKTEGPDVACDYPPYKLNKLIAKKFEDSGSPAVDLIKNFEWTNDDQNVVSTYIARDEMKPADAAKKWIKDNPDKVDAWLK